MKLGKPSGRASGVQRAAGRIILPALIASAAGALGWIWWQSARPITRGAARLAPVPSQVIRSNGALIIPVADRDGRRRDPMVLLPVRRADSSVSPQMPSPTGPSTVVPAPVPPVPVSSNFPPVPALITTTPATNGVTRLPVNPEPFPAGNNKLPPVATTNAADRPHKGFDERLLAAQVALASLGFSSGSIDGVPGPQSRAAIRAFQQREHLPTTGNLDATTFDRLAAGEPPYVTHIVSEEDLAGLHPLGGTWLAKSQQGGLAHETLLERLAERTRTNPKLLRWLNPGTDWERVTAGASLKLLQVDEPVPGARAAFVRISLAERKLQAFDAETNLIAHFPCSIAARVDKRPLGEELHITVVAPKPNYTFDPAVFPESAEARALGRKLILQPGPNNPVGTIWLGLDKPGYGIHGTPKPEDVGRTESHGCFRLANWNAEHLLKLVTVGTPVFVEP